jgi:endonuclease III
MHEELRKRASKILGELKRRYPEATTILKARDPYQLLVAVILSAQCTDERVNKVTSGLFKKHRTAEDFAGLEQKDLEKEIRSTGFFRNKAKNIIAMSKKILRDFGGEVPRTMAELITLNGVARKTANIVLYHGFGMNEGIAVDTHVFRVTARLGLSSGKNPETTEKELMALYKKEDYGIVSDAVILFGRDICQARKPKCEICPFRKTCDYYRNVISV